jgi:8-amino-7-oxononanoate synthase
MLGPELTFVGRTGVLFEGRELTFFGGNDYHRLSRHPEVVQALIDGALRYGLNPSGSRVTSGNHPLYLQLEAKIATFLGTEAATLLPAGYMSNAALLDAIVEEFTVLFVDEKAHPSLREAAAQSGRRVVAFRHADLEDLAARCAEILQTADRPLLLTDGVAANTGDMAPLAAYLEILRPWDGRVHVDDCHGLGVLGATGKGSWEAAGISREGTYQAGTLSKAFGSFGGLVAGSDALIQSLRTRSMGFVGSTPMPLPVAAAALRSLELLTAAPEMISQLAERVLTFKAFLRSQGFRAATGASPICSVTFFDEARNRILFQLLLENGIYPSFINYPGCPPGGHFRFTLSGAHTEEQLNALRIAIESSVRENGPPPPLSLP